MRKKIISQKIQKIHDQALLSIEKLSSKDDFLIFFNNNKIESDKMFKALLSEKKIRTNLKMKLSYMIKHLLRENVLGNINFQITTSFSKEKAKELLFLLPSMPQEYSPLRFKFPIKPSSLNSVIQICIDPLLYEEIKEDIISANINNIIKMDD